MFRAPQHIAVVDPLGWITCLSFWKSGPWKNKRAVRLFSLSFLRTKSCVLVQILQTPLNCFWHHVDLYLKVRLFFHLDSPPLIKPWLNFVTCKNNYVRYNGVQHNIQCDCWMQKEISVAPKTLKNGSKPPINGVQPEQTSIFRISSMKWRNTFSLKVLFSI